MSRHCPVCRVVIYGRSDKRYCSPTCRRDACRARTREILIGDETHVGSEWSWPLERHLIPVLERQYGPHHRVVARARKYAAEIRKERYKELARTMRRFEFEELIARHKRGHLTDEELFAAVGLLRERGLKAESE